MRGLAIFSGSMCGPLLALSAPLSAGTTSATLDVSLTVLPGCAVLVAPLAFAARAGSAADAEAEIEVQCSGDTAVAVSLDAGRHSADGQRRLSREGGPEVAYSVYSDAARTRPWSRGALAGQAAGGTALRLMAYGRIEARDSAVPTGDYRDSITVTVAF